MAEFSKRNESEVYMTSNMQREIVVKRLRDRGCRITKQRLMLLDIILNEECSCCKEIYYKASKLDAGIGTATVYRMVNILEDIGAINRKNMYKISCDAACKATCAAKDTCVVSLDDDTVYHLTAKNWNKVILEGLKTLGYVTNQNIKSIVVRPCTK